MREVFLEDRDAFYVSLGVKKMNVIRVLLLCYCCNTANDVVAKILPKFSKTETSFSSLTSRLKSKVQQVTAGTLVVCSTIGLLSCSPIHLYERESTSEEQVGHVPIAKIRWQEHEWGGKIAIDNHTNEYVGVDYELKLQSEKRLGELRELAKKFSLEMKKFQRIRAYDPNWHSHFEEVSIVHSQLEAWYSIYGDKPKYYGFDPSFMANLGSALEDSTLDTIGTTFGVEFGGELLEGFDNFGWVFHKREWPPQFGFSKEDVIWGLSGLDVAKFNSMRSHLRASDYHGVVILYRNSDDSYHIGQVFSQIETHPPLLKTTSVFEDQQNYVITTDHIEGINIADDLVHSSHKLLSGSRFIEFPANTIIQVIQGSESILQESNEKLEGRIEMVFSNGYLLATVEAEQEEYPTFLLLKYEPTVKDRFDPANWNF